MESFNSVHLVGKIRGQATFKMLSGGSETALFQVVTYNLKAGTDGGKALVDQVHRVALRNCSTIKDALTDGKSVFVDGKLAYSASGLAHIDARTIVFTGKRGE